MSEGLFAVAPEDLPPGVMLPPMDPIAAPEPPPEPTPPPAAAGGMEAAFALGLLVDLGTGGLRQVLGADLPPDCPAWVPTPQERAGMLAAATAALERFDAVERFTAQAPVIVSGAAVVSYVNRSMVQAREARAAAANFAAYAEPQPEPASFGIRTAAPDTPAAGGIFDLEDTHGPSGPGPDPLGAPESGADKPRTALDRDALAGLAAGLTGGGALGG